MKFVGTVGFWINDVEVEPSVYKSMIVEKPYTGDLLKNTQRWSNQNSKVNADFVISNKIRIMADMYMNRNWQSIKFVKFKGNDTPFTVTEVDLDYPGITITIGGRYNGEDSPRIGC